MFGETPTEGALSVVVLLEAVPPEAAKNDATCAIGTIGAIGVIAAVSHEKELFMQVTLGDRPGL